MLYFFYNKVFFYFRLYSQKLFLQLNIVKYLVVKLYKYNWQLLKKYYLKTIIIKDLRG